MSRMNPRKSPRAKAVWLAAALTASTGLAAPTAVAAPGPSGAPVTAQQAGSAATFYDPPTELPSRNGALIRTEALRLALGLPGVTGPLPGRATRIMYRSTDSAGAPVAVTGAYVEPTVRWTGSGPRPLVALAPGTMGQGDHCAPSKALEKPLSLQDGSVSVGYENLAVYRLLARGAAVVVTDYVGLGTTGRLHTYVNRLDGGHAVLDAVRAARALPGTSLTSRSPVGLYGYSEGGGAAASAAELQPSYAPDVPLAGAYAGAPPADLVAVLKAVDGSTLAAALGWSINGFVQSDPGMKPVLDKYINDKGRQALAELSEACVGNGILGFAGAESTTWTKDGTSVADIVAAEPVVRAVLDGQRLGRTAPAAPVRVATGVHDDLVVHAQARRLAVDWCAAGADVTYVPVEVPDLGEKLVNHFLPLITDQGDAIDWLTDRLAGRPAGSDCGALGR
ncbi:lipase family protein [Streptomyces sp. NPDC093094]|uniref:lipase family protein n=1 Tax=Streptomyces sp. NPDC093094 TaxID=3366026 RepID=UPI003807A879